MYSVSLSSYGNTREPLGELEKAVEHSPVARVPTAFLVVPNFHSCFYNSIETWYMFYVFYFLNIGCDEFHNEFLKRIRKMLVYFPADFR